MAKKRAKALEAGRPAAKRSKAPAWCLKSWLAGYAAGENGAPHRACPRRFHRDSWQAGHLVAYKHDLLAKARRHAMNARHHGGEALAEVAVHMDPVDNGAYGRGFLAGMRLAAGLTWRA